MSGATSNSDGAGAGDRSAGGSSASRIETGDDDEDAEANEDAEADVEAEAAVAKALLLPPNSRTKSEGASTSAVDTLCAPTPAPDGAAQRVRNESTMRCGRENGAEEAAAEAAAAEADAEAVEADAARAASETTMGGDAPFLAISITPARGRSVTHTRSPLTNESRSAVHCRCCATASDTEADRPVFKTSPPLTPPA